MADRRVIHLKRVALAGAGATLVFGSEALGAQVFQRPGNGTCVYELAFSGMRCKPDYHYRFVSAEAAAAHRDAWAASKRASLDAKQQRVALRREQLRGAGARLVVGDVLVASWGYEQTNYDYYQVTRVFGVRSVEIRELAQSAAENTGLAMQGDCVPLKDRFIAAPMVKRVDERGRVKVRSWGVWASKKTSVLVAGVELFEPDHYTSYA